MTTTGAGHPRDPWPRMKTMGKQQDQMWGMVLFLTIVTACMLALMIFILFRASIIVPLAT